MGGYKRVHEEAIDKIIESATKNNWTKERITRTMSYTGFTQEDINYVCRIVKEHRDAKNARDS